MEITVIRMGGFANVYEKLGPVDTTAVAGDMGQRIESKVGEIGFFELPERIPEDRPHSSEPFGYTVTIHDGSRQHVVRYDDNSEHQAVQSLRGFVRLLEESGFKFESSVPESHLTASSDGFSWLAWYNRMPGVEDPDLHVVGTCTFGDSEVQLSLEPGDGGIVPEPGLVALKLTITRPQRGDDVMTEKRVEWQGDVGPDIDRVRIQGDAQEKLAVIIAL